jgi:hypothetical protein
MPEPENQPPSLVADEERAPGSSDLKPEDYYFDGAYLVFTEAYHRKRGYCCNSGCRHCPWREVKADSSAFDHARRASNATE